MPETQENTERYRFGEFELNAVERLLMRYGERVPLTPRALDLLIRLVRTRGSLVSKETLIDDVWSDAVVEEGNLNRTISALRKTLGEQKGENRFIQTVPKIGYRFVADVEVLNGHHPVAAPTAPVRENAEKRRRNWLPVLAVGAFILLFGVLVGTYLFSRTTTESATAEVKKNEPVRLTNNAFQEDAAIWGADNRIRFIRFTSTNKVASYVIDADGANESRPETQIKHLRTGTWSPDGKRVVFSRENEPGTNIYLAEADGSGEVRLPFYPGSLSWSPDGTKFVYGAEFPVGSKNQEILVYDVAAKKSSVVVGHPAFDANPSFSPDGKQVIFNSERDGNAEIYLVNIDGAGLRRMTNHPAKEAFQVFSPDRTQIAFNSARENEKVGIYLLNVNDDSPPVRISDISYNSEIRSGCWSPDGMRIVFTSDKESTNFNLYTMSVEPFAPKKILADEKADLQFPAMSPDGEKLAYSARSSDSSAEIRILDIASNRISTIAKTENADLFLSWSPDGAKLSFSCKQQGNTEICVVDADGSGLKNLTNDPARDSGATWSPNGSEIIFSSNRGGGSEKTYLFRMNANGSEPRRVTDKESYEMTPAWSADGRLFFAGDRLDGRSQVLDIFSLTLDAPNEETIVASRRFHDTLPSTSPDGKRVAFVAQSDGNDEIYMMNADGSGLVRVTRNAASDQHPRFSHDGKKIVFSSNRNGKFELFEIVLPPS